jgi:large subunit ribosomal protein L24e
MLPFSLLGLYTYQCYFHNSEIKERIKKTKDEKKAKKAEVAKSQKASGKGNAPKPGKGPKLGGGGGKR